MVKLVDMPDLGSGAARRVGSSPIIRTKNAIILNLDSWVFWFNRFRDFLSQNNICNIILKLAYNKKPRTCLSYNYYFKAQ